MKICISYERLDEFQWNFHEESNNVTQRYYQKNQQCLFNCGSNFFNNSVHDAQKGRGQKDRGKSQVEMSGWKNLHGFKNAVNSWQRSLNEKSIGIISLLGNLCLKSLMNFVHQQHQHVLYHTVEYILLPFDASILTLTFLYVRNKGNAISSSKLPSTQ